MPGCGQFTMRKGYRCKIKSHGHSVGGTSPTYNSWASMKQRCNYPKSASYERYGGRGISVCERWLTFDNFLADMGVRPEGMTLDRKGANGNYEPDNCKWSTLSEQALNQRPNKRGCKLTRVCVERIRDIKRCSTLTETQIANYFGVSRSAVSHILLGLTWQAKTSLT